MASKVKDTKVAEKLARITHDVTGDVDVTDAVRRHKELSEWKKQAEAELKEIGEKLSVRMAEHNADALRQDGVTVCHRVQYNRETVPAKELKASHPRIFARLVKRTWVAYVATD